MVDDDGPVHAEQRVSAHADGSAGEGPMKLRCANGRHAPPQPNGTTPRFRSLRFLHDVGIRWSEIGDATNLIH